MQAGERQLQMGRYCQISFTAFFLLNTVSTFRSSWDFSMAQESHCIRLFLIFVNGKKLNSPATQDTTINTHQGRCSNPKLWGQPPPHSCPSRVCVCVCMCTGCVCVSACESLTLQLLCAKWLFLTAHRMPNSTEWVNWHFKKVIVKCNRQGYRQNWEVECRSPTHWRLSHLEEQAEDKSRATTVSWFSLSAATVRPQCSLFECAVSSQ